MAYSNFSSIEATIALCTFKIDMRDKEDSLVNMAIKQLITNISYKAEPIEDKYLIEAYIVVHKFFQ